VRRRRAEAVARREDLPMRESANYERWRMWITAGLIAAAVLILGFWVLWWSDRSLVASRSSRAYYAFEEGFQLADGWLLLAVLAAAIQLARRRGDALVWLVAAAGGALYLLGMDLYYDLGHGIYGSGTGGVIELVIDILLAAGSLVALRWAWVHRWALLDGAGPRASDVAGRRTREAARGRVGAQRRS
jgi:hypothetical protein